MALDLIECESEPFKRRPPRLEQPEVHKRAAQGAAEQELNRQIRHAFGAGRSVAAFCEEQRVHELLARGEREGVPQIRVGGCVPVLHQRVPHVVFDPIDELVGVGQQNRQVRHWRRSVRRTPPVPGGGQAHFLYRQPAAGARTVS